MTNKNSKYTHQFEEVAEKYGLKLDGAWNKELMPHRGRHPIDEKNIYKDIDLNCNLIKAYSYSKKMTLMLRILL